MMRPDIFSRAGVSSPARGGGAAEGGGGGQRCAHLPPRPRFARGHLPREERGRKVKRKTKIEYGLGAMTICARCCSCRRTATKTCEGQSLRQPMHSFSISKILLQREQVARAGLMREFVSSCFGAELGAHQPQSRARIRRRSRSGRCCAPRGRCRAQARFTAIITHARCRSPDAGTRERIARTRHLRHSGGERNRQRPF